MTQIIQPKSINFNELVKNSNTTLSLNLQTKLVDKLNDNFNEEEQHWYVANLYMYMNYHPTSDFPINLENVFSMIGFANKGNAMKTIKNNFIENEDYKIVIFRTEKNLNVKDLGGRPVDTVMLNIDTFKNLCMIAKTEKGKEIRKYYVKLEDIYNAIIKEELEENKKELEQNKKELEENKKELATLKRLKSKKWYNQEPGDTIYAIKVDNIIKIGKTRNIKKREAYYTENQVGDMFYIKKCYNCDLTEKVIHHILDKHREERNSEWFNISDELAIYIIDIVCNFLDNFIDSSEKLPLSNLKESINEAMNINKNQNENKKESDSDNNNNSMLNKVVKIDCNHDKMKRFISEFCELDENHYVLSYELFGAYRIWSKGLTNSERSEFSKFVKQNYTSKRKYYKEYDSSLLTYFGIKPKDLKIPKNETTELVIPKYEEFIQTECKYNYNYRMSYKTFIDNYKMWCSTKYPDYTISKQEQFNMDTYINKYFLKEKINMPGYRNVLGIWGFQLKSENTFKVGLIPEHRKEIVKIDYNTRVVIEEFKSLEMASKILKSNTSTIRSIIQSKKVVNNEYILEFKKSILHQ